jgi:hypothetical protein
MHQQDSDILSTLVQAFSALSIFVFYFGWVWQDAFFQIFGIRISAFEFPFYHFLIQGLKVNFPFQFDAPTLTRWEYLAWVINTFLVSCTLVANTSTRFKNFHSNHPLISAIGVTCLLAGLFIAVHYVGTKAGHERGRAILHTPGQLRLVLYEYQLDSNSQRNRFYGYLLMLTKDSLYVLDATALDAKPRANSTVGATPELSVVPLDRISYLKTSGYPFSR